MAAWLLDRPIILRVIRIPDASGTIDAGRRPPGSPAAMRILFQHATIAVEEGER
jgi:hypothetical protein